MHFRVSTDILTGMQGTDRNAAEPRTRWEAGYIGALVFAGALLGSVVTLVAWLLDSHRSLGYGLGAGAGLVAVGLLLVAFRRGLERSGKLPTDRGTPNLSPTGHGPRNHVICLDGTWNEPLVDTNVWKLFQRLPKDSDTQIARYYSGVGTRELRGVRSDFVRRHLRRKRFEGATAYGARGATNILRRAYFDFVRSYRPDDRIYILGFSRGAATARALANYICKTHGLPVAVDLTYLKNRKQSDVVTGMEVTDRDPPITPNVRFLGLWDTVASMGIPVNHREPFDLTIPPGVETVVHLVAIDEQEPGYDVVLVGQDDRVEEVWFPGVHGNVGGTLADRTLSDITLSYMIERAAGAGVRFRDDAPTLPRSFTAVPAGWVWTAASSPIVRIVREVRLEPRSPGGRPRIHKSAFILRDAGIRYAPANLPELYVVQDD